MRHPFLKFALPFMFRLRNDDPDAELDFGNDFDGDAIDKAKAQQKAGDDIDPLKEAEAAAEKKALDAAAAAEATKQGKPKTAATEAEEDKTKAKKPEAEAEDETKGKNGAIPLDRHKAILERERERRTQLEAQLANYQKGEVVRDLNKELTESEKKVADLEKEYAELLAEGKTAEATAKMSEVRKLERQMAQDKSDLAIAAAEARAIERSRFAIALERIETAFPQLNEDHEDYDKELMGEVVELKSAYEARGMTPTDAMQKAVKLLVRPTTQKQKDSTTVTPRVDEKAAIEGDTETKKAEAERERRATEARKKAAEADTKQPPTTTKVGTDHDRLGGAEVTPEKLVKMTDKEFEALSEKDLSRLRGDTLD